MKLINKRRFYTFIFIVITLIIIGVYRANGSGELQDQWQEYYVREGDTLWSITDENYNNLIRRDETIYKIKQKNGIDSNIYQGQTILIPMEGLKRVIFALCV